MRAQVHNGNQGPPAWHNFVEVRHINVTVAKESAESADGTLMRELEKIDGVIRVDARAPAVIPTVPAEMEIFATRLWEVL